MIYKWENFSHFVSQTYMINLNLSCICVFLIVRENSLTLYSKNPLCGVFDKKDCWEGSMEIEDGWQTVWSRWEKPKKNFGGIWDSRKGRGLGRDEHVSNFFFTEFPESHQAKEMFEIFEHYGLIDEVVIPQKRCKRGKRYGFVRFRMVGDEAALTIKSDNIFIKSKKIYTNIPKFQRRWLASEVKHRGVKENDCGGRHTFGNIQRKFYVHIVRR